MLKNFVGKKLLEKATTGVAGIVDIKDPETRVKNKITCNYYYSLKRKGMRIKNSIVVKDKYDNAIYTIVFKKYGSRRPAAYLKDLGEKVICSVQAKKSFWSGITTYTVDVDGTAIQFDNKKKTASKIFVEKYGYTSKYKLKGLYESICNGEKEVVFNVYAYVDNNYEYYIECNDEKYVLIGLVYIMIEDIDYHGIKIEHYPEG